MEMTAEQIAEVMALLDASTGLPAQVVRQWIHDNGLEEQIKIPQVMRQLRKANPTAMLLITAPRFLKRVPRQVCNNESITVEICDALIASLQDGLVVVQAKKAELEA